MTVGTKTLPVVALGEGVGFGDGDSFSIAGVEGEGGIGFCGCADFGDTGGVVGFSVSFCLSLSLLSDSGDIGKDVLGFCSCLYFKRKQSEFYQKSGS
ncbi:MAG: hypothetical protein IGS23_19490 [Rivularia sp. T60_A2020_040]|nr:hypothetical protein [Rivularia sp. T60_A2020_040]